MFGVIRYFNISAYFAQNDDLCCFQYGIILMLHGDELKAKGTGVGSEQLRSPLVLATGLESGQNGF